jgi:hypothetical protein
MDTLSHGLWGAAAALAIGLRSTVTPRQTLGAAAMGVLPDVAQAMPVLAWAVTQPDAITVMTSFTFATPARDVQLPGGIAASSHHVHCAMHSIFFAALATLLAYRFRPGLLVPIAGWWAHIALDIPSHSASYYAVPFLYPFTYWGFDGIAWTTTWVLVLNYAGLLAAYSVLVMRYRRLEREIPVPGMRSRVPREP